MVNYYFTKKPFLYLIILSTLSTPIIPYSLIIRSLHVAVMSNKKLLTTTISSTKSIKSFFTSSSISNENHKNGDSVINNNRNDAFQAIKKAKLEHICESLIPDGGDIDAIIDQQTEVSIVDDKKDYYLTSSSSMEGSNAINTTISNTTSTSTTINNSSSQWKPFDEMEIGWRTSLLSEANKPYFKSLLLTFLNTEIKSGKTIYPPAKYIFTAFNLCPLDQVKVVIIGQDPYHGPGQAHGLAFSVGKEIQIPPSLKNIITEAKNDPGVNITQTSCHGNLECWAKQGVLMLNTVLTVRKGDANSHQKKGWEEFTDAVVRELNKKSNIVYLLWGNPAQNKCKCINSSRNTLIKTSHPSPLGAYKTSEPFMGSRCFSRCNEALIKYNQTPIDWNIV